MTALQRVRKIAHDVFTFKVLVAFVLGGLTTRLFGAQGHTALPTWANTDDAYGALREFIKLRGLEAVKKYPPHTRDDFSRLLIDLGIRDRSNNRLPKEARQP